MKSASIIICVLLAIAQSSVMAQREGQVPTISAPVGVYCRVDGEVRNELGLLKVGLQAEHRRRVVNLAVGTLALRVVEVSCPCVTTKLEPAEIPPSGESVVRILTPVAPASGRQVHWAIIEATARDAAGQALARERFRLEVAYEADLEFVVEPTELWIVVAEGEEANRVVYVRSTMMESLRPRDFRAEGEGVRIRGTQLFPVPTDLRPGEEAIAISVGIAGRQKGLYEGKIAFRTNSRDFPEASVPCHIRVVPRFIAEPAGFPIIVGRAEAPIHQLVRVFSRDGTPCPAIRAEVRDEHGREPGPPGLSVRLARDPQGGGVRVSLTANPGALSAEGIASIILLNDRGETIRQLPVAWVKPVDRLAPTRPSP